MRREFLFYTSTCISSKNCYFAAKERSDLLHIFLINGFISNNIPDRLRMYSDKIVHFVFFYLYFFSTYFIEIS